MHSPTSTPTNLALVLSSLMLFLLSPGVASAQQQGHNLPGVFAPRIGATIVARYVPEFGARNTTQGHTFALSIAFVVKPLSPPPSPPPPPSVTP